MARNSDDVTTATHDDGQPAKRKRLRIPKSCLPCLKGKRACDRGRPACGRCARAGQGSECSYDSRLPHQPASGPSKQPGSYDDSEDDDDTPPQDSKQLLALRRELEEARNETRRLQQLLHTQSHASASTSRTPDTSSWPHTSTASERHHHSYSSSNDMHAARGLQMLAEIAGPQHQDADSNAVKSRILDWSGPGLQATSSSRASPSDPAASSSHDAWRPSDRSASTASSPADRFTNATATPSVYRHQLQRRPSHHHSHELDSPKNINGTRMYYGDTSSGDKVLRKVAAGTAASSRTNAGNLATGIHETMARKDMQSAFNSVLDPSRDTFPFATIWSSGTAFIDEVLPFFPKPEDFDSICASFVRHFSAMCPALTIPTAIDHAKAFSRMSRKQQSQVSLPWLAVFLMICALGKNCDLESTTVGVDRKVRMLDAFLTGEASQQASRHASRASSPSPRPAAEAASSQSATADAQQQSTSTTSRSPAMVSDLFLSAAYQSLRLCSFLSAPTLQTIHSQLLIGAYLLNTERAASFWPLLGSVARQAQSIGLHVDPYKIKHDWDPVEADMRRRLWWAVVHQDVILSGIFGRPLGITRFSCRFPGIKGGDSPGAITYAILQCEFSQFARTYLDENQDRSWSQAKIIAFTEQVLQWYMNIPDRYRPDLGRIDLLGSDTEEEAIHNYHAAGVDIKTKGLMEVHQSGNLAVEVFYTILSLHRSNLFPVADAEPDASGKVGGSSSSSSDPPVKSTGSELNQVSLHICAQALRRITRAQQTMIDLLGRARATMFWKIAYYTYQAAIAGAYIVFVNPQSKHAESALEDLAILTDFFDRMPEKWTGLKMAKPGLRVLRKLAVAARETPGAASMAFRNTSQQQQHQQQSANDSVDPASPLATNGSTPGRGQQQQHDEILVKPDSNATTPRLADMHAANTPPPHLLPTPAAIHGDASQMSFNSQSAFLPPIFNSSFMSPTAGPQGMMGNTPMIHSPLATTSMTPNVNSFGGSFAEPTSLFAGALAASVGSPLTRSLASVPLVTLFNNTYDQQENDLSAPPKQSFCYDPFIPDPSTSTSSNNNSSSSDSAQGGRSSGSPSTPDRRTGSLHSPTTFSTHASTLSNVAGVAADVGLVGEKDRAAAYGGDGSAMQHDQQHEVSPAPMNQKDLANYWSEYFSLQLDWDRLTGLA